VKNYGRLGPENVMFNYSGCAGIIIVEADRLGVSSIHLPCFLLNYFWLSDNYIIVFYFCTFCLFFRTTLLLFPRVAAVNS